MRRPPAIAGLSLLLLLAGGAAATACSLVRMLQEEFDYTRYVFEGEVLELVGPLRSDDWPGETWGVRLAVTRAVHLPSPREEYDVVPLGIRPDCSTWTFSEEELAGRFAAGDRVRVVAGESQFGSELLLSCPVCGHSWLETVAESKSMAREVWGDGVKGLDEGGQVIDEYEFQVVLLGLETAVSAEQRAPLLEALVPYLGGPEWLESMLRLHPVDAELQEELLRRARAAHPDG